MRSWFLTAAERGNDATRLRAWTEGNAVRPLVHGSVYFSALAEVLACAGVGRDDADHAGDPQPISASARYGATPARHDVQVELRGPAVREVDDVFRERWDDPVPAALASALRPAAPPAAGPVAAAAPVGGPAAGPDLLRADPAHVPHPPPVVALRPAG